VSTTHLVSQCDTLSLLLNKGTEQKFNRPWRPWEGEDIHLYSSFNLSARWGGWSMPCPSCFNPRKEPVPTEYKAGWAAGPVWMGAKNLAPTRFWSPDPPAHIGSLYQLRYPSLQGKNVTCFKVQFVPHSKHCVGYKNQSLNATHGKSCCLFWDTYKTHDQTLQAEHRTSKC